MDRAGVGPLLYHYEDMDGEPSLELSYSELRSVVHAVGFTFEVSARLPSRPTATYSQTLVLCLFGSFEHKNRPRDGGTARMRPMCGPCTMSSTTAFSSARSPPKRPFLD